MKKFYLIFAALLVSLTTLSASAATMTFKLDHPERFTASTDGWGVTVPEISGDTYVLEYTPDPYSYYPDNFLLKPNTGCYVVKCIDDATGDEVALNYNGYVSVPMTEANDGKTFTVTSGNLDEERQNNTFELTIDNPDKARIQYNGAGYTEYLTVNKDEVNKIGFIPGKDTPITIMSANDPYHEIFAKVTLDGTVIEPVNLYNRYSYTITPKNGSKVNIVTAFEDKDCKLTIRVPEAFAADFDKIVTRIFVVNDEGRSIEVDKKAELTVKMGRLVQIETSSDYKFINYSVNGGDPKMRDGSYAQLFMTGTDMVIDLNIENFKEYPVKVNITDPAHIRVVNSRRTDDYVYELQAGENTIYVPENNTTVNIYPNTGCYIESCTDENGKDLDYTSYANPPYYYFSLRINEDGTCTPGTVNIVSGVYSTDPIEIKLGENTKQYEFNKIFSRVYDATDEKDVEMTATGFTAYAGHKYSVYNNSQDYDIANAKYIEGEEVTNASYSGLVFTVKKEGGVIEADVTPFPTRTFTLYINDLTNAKVYRGYYSTWGTNVEITGLKENEPNELTFSYGTYVSGPQLSVVSTGDAELLITNKKGDTLQNLGFYIEEDNDEITVNVRKIVREKRAIVYVKNRDIADYNFYLNNKAGAEIYDKDWFEEGHNEIFFDDSFDNPLEFNMNGGELYSEDIKAFVNNEKIVTSGYSFKVSAKQNDIVKIYLGEVDSEFLTANWTVEGKPEFTVTVDMIKELTKDAIMAAPAQKELPGTLYAIKPADSSKDMVVTVDAQPVEKDADGNYVFSVEKNSDIKVSDTESAITGIETDIDASSTDVYNLQGIRILTAPTQEEINALPAGLYIQKGKKIVVK